MSAAVGLENAQLPSPYGGHQIQHGANNGGGGPAYYSSAPMQVDNAIAAARPPVQQHFGVPGDGYQPSHPGPSASAGSAGFGAFQHHQQQQQQQQQPYQYNPNFIPYAQNQRQHAPARSYQQPPQQQHFPAQAPLSAPAAAATATAVEQQQEEVPAQQEENNDEDLEEETKPKRYSRRGKERIRRIHLPVREGADELSDSEGSGSDWGESADLPEEQRNKLPPGYMGRRRIKKPADGKIKPAYYYPTEGSTRGVPVFEPTYEEFRDFNTFINKIDNYGMRSGIVKIVPPKEWHDSLVSVSQPLKDTIVRDAIEQNFMGSQGLFKQSNIASRRLYNIKQWKELCESDKYRTPDFFGAEKDRRKTKDEPDDDADSAAGGTPASTRSSKTRSARAPAAPTTRKTRNAPTRAASRRGKAKEENPAPSVASETPTMEEDSVAPDASIVDGKSEEQEGSEPKAEEPVNDQAKTETTAVPAESSVPEVQAKLSPADTTESTMQAVQAEDTLDKKPAIITAPAVDVDADANGTAVPATPAKPEAEITSTEAPGTAKSESKTGEMSTRKRRRLREEEKEDWDEEWAKFDYASLPHGAKPHDFTVEECRKIEKYYWRNFTFGAPPMYGADGTGSLFDESTKEWNVAALDDLLMRINPHMPMPGVNTPYLYFGMWRATFSWHVEDADLYSINHLHFGAPKFWYSVSQQHAEHFERVMASYFQRDRQKCPEFLRHKAYLVSPQKLAKDGIPLNRVVQFPGEIVLTYPYGYHSGFNSGFNCAESINFATEGWLDIGRKAHPCTCVSDSVHIDVDKWLEEAREDAEKIRSDPIYAAQRKHERELAVIIPQHEAKRRRIMGPDYVERKPRLAAQPRMQPRPSKTAADNSKVQNENQGHGHFAQRNKGAHQQKALAPSAPANRPQVTSFMKPVHNGMQAHYSANAQQHLKNGQNGTVTPPQQAFYPCALCPEQVMDGLVRVKDPGPRNKNKVLYAHKICVTFTPTTWVAPDPVTREELVHGFELIEKERWNLKCALCNDRHGTKIQCTKTQKCVRAFHATCAVKEDSGVLLDALLGGKSVLDPTTEKPTAENVAATDEGHLVLQVACRQHNPTWMKAQAEKRRGELAHRAALVPIGHQIQIRTTTGIYRVTVLGQRVDQQAVEIVFGDGTRALCKYGAIVWPEEAAKLQAEQVAQVAPPLAQPRLHPMERSRSGHSHTPNARVNAHTPQIPVTQRPSPAMQQHHHQQHQLAQSTGHPYPMPQYAQPQPPMQQQYYSQQQYQMPQMQHQPQHQSHLSPHAQHAVPSFGNPALQQSNGYTSPNLAQSQMRQTASNSPVQSNSGFTSQPIPYYNGKAVHVHSRPTPPQQQTVQL